ncbi:MAG: glycoside hydrolase N-terminal domain-containing protein [Clostridia bacterium]|nr:glycoside hydrolase N-terminal domain-containing protein [Clostridia bacterium]
MNFMRLQKYDMRYEDTILNWDEALPLGNGILGCLVYGDGPIRLSIDRGDLWDNRPHPTTVNDKGFNYKNMLKLVRDGSEDSWEEYRRLFDVIYSEHPYPSKITAGRIELDFGKKVKTTSSVSLGKATANVTLDNEQTGKLQAFVSAVRPVGAVKVTGEFTMNLHIPNYISGDENGECISDSGIGGERMHCMQYPRAEIISEGEFTYYKQYTKTEFEYGVVVLRKKREDFEELYYTVMTNKIGDDFIKQAKALLQSCAELGYDDLKKEHENWWKRYWSKSEIKIGDELLEKTYYRSWYLFASCSRKGGYPMPLQGVWTADNDSLPPWKGDYHHDTNTQLSYQAYLKANHMEEGKVFVDYLWSLRGQFRKFARNFYGVKGLLIPGVSTQSGLPMGGWAQYSLSPTMSIWSAQSFDEYYLYTGDKSYLKNRAYPFMKEIGDAIYGLLEEKNGKLYLPLSTSPEIYDDTPQSYLEPNSNFDLALLIYLYRTLKKYTVELGLDGSKYDEILSKFDDIALDDKMIVRLDKTQNLPETHRHFSHLMCLYPLHVINFDTEENQLIYLRSLWELEGHGMGLWVGFSYGMCAQIYAMALKGNSAYEKLRQFANGFVAENGFHLNGDFKDYGYSTFHYRPFTLESSFGYCDALHEMLLQDHQGYIHLFPAIPTDWKDREVSFKKIRSMGGVLVSAKSKNNLLAQAEFESLKPTTVRVKNVFADRVVYVEKNGKAEAITADEEDMFTVELIRGKTKLYVK